MKRVIKNIACLLIFSASLYTPQASYGSEKRGGEKTGTDLNRHSILNKISHLENDHASKECIWNNDNLAGLKNMVNSIDLTSATWQSDILQSIPLQCIHEYIDGTYQHDIAMKLKLEIENGHWDNFLRQDREESAKLIDGTQTDRHPDKVILQMPLSITLFSMTRPD